MMAEHTGQPCNLLAFIPPCSVALIVLILLLLLHLYIHLSFYTVLTALLSVASHTFVAAHMGGKLPMSPCTRTAVVH